MNTREDTSRRGPSPRTARVDRPTPVGSAIADARKTVKSWYRDVKSRISYKLGMILCSSSNPRALQLGAARRRAERRLERRLEACLVEQELLEAKLALAEEDQRQHEALRGRLAAAAGFPLPVYVLSDLRISAQPRLGSTPNRVFVCSIPKSGTYLVSELLCQLGYQPTRLHLWTDGLSDYRSATLREAREEYHRFSLSMPLARSASLVLPGQFGVGHLECTEEIRHCLSEFKIIFTYRNIKDSFVSHMRFMCDTGRCKLAPDEWNTLPEGPERMLAYMESEPGRSFIRLCRPMIDWVRRAGRVPLAIRATLWRLGRGFAPRVDPNPSRVPGDLGWLRRTS